MKHLFIKAGGAGGRHVHLILRILPVVFLCYAVYLLLGMWLPFLFQPGVSKEFQRGFDKSGFYGTGSVDRAALIDDNVAALEIRIRMIEEAQKRLIFTNFDIRDCESGRDVAAALLAAAERGVQVQVLTDGMNGLVSMASSPVFYALGAHPNIEIRFYNTPNPLMPWTFNGRLHDKYILSDDRLLLAGGRNTFDKFLGDYVPYPEKSHDLDILFYNSAAGTADSGESVLHQVEQYFQMVWSDSHSKTWLESAPFFYRKSVLLETEALHMRHSAWREAHPELLSKENTDYIEATVPLKAVTFIHNPINILAKEPLVWWQLQQLMEGAEERVYLQTPYAVCDQSMYDGLSRVAGRGVPFSVQINSMGVGDNFMASSDYYRNKARVLDTGAQVWEWYGDYSSHGKSLLIDQDLAAVGSYNLDMRSTYVDTEVMFVIHGEEFNAVLEHYLAEMEEDSLLVSGLETYVEKEGVTPWDNGDWKHALYPITSLLVQPFRCLL